jgi:TRAP-type C4-dicarboxylate transport system substrate-binding protein
MNIFGTLVRRALLAGMAAASVWGLSAQAEPVKLRFAVFSPDTEQTYLSVFKPFVDAVNRDAAGTVVIELLPNGALGRSPVQQAQMVLDGVADLAWVVPSFTPGRFPDMEVFELPGLFRDLTESTLVMTRLIDSGRIKGYGQFVPIGTFGTAPYSIHTRMPIRTLADLKGRKIRVTGAIEGDTLRALGVVPIGMPTNEVTEAVGRGTIDGTTAHPAPLFDFGFNRVVKAHYFIRLGVVPIAVLMNKAKFDSLPKAGQDAIRKHSGLWIAQLFDTSITAYNNELMKTLTGDPKRSVVFPSSADEAVIQRAFNTVVDAWVAQSPHHKQLLGLVTEEIAAVRAGK